MNRGLRCWRSKQPKCDTEGGKQDQELKEFERVFPPYGVDNMDDIDLF